jgi:hypothetical protein
MLQGVYQANTTQEVLAEDPAGLWVKGRCKNHGVEVRGVAEMLARVDVLRRSRWWGRQPCVYRAGRQDVHVLLGLGPPVCVPCFRPLNKPTLNIVHLPSGIGDGPGAAGWQMS